MEYDLRSGFPEYIVKTFHLPYVAHHRFKIELRILFLKFQTKIVHRGLGIVEKDKLRHSESCKLTA